MTAGTSWISLHASPIIRLGQATGLSKTAPHPLFGENLKIWFVGQTSWQKFWGLGHAATSIVIKFGNGGGKSILYRLGA
jgi:hypothetical protein